MTKFKRFITLWGLLPLLLLTSCNNNKAPKDYELTPEVSNKDGSVYYEIFVRSFADSNGDGHGDLNGVTAKLPYLQELGVKGIWLTPIHPSPSDHGYDVTDYMGVHSDFGTISDFDNLIATANELNIDVIIDLVLNHSASSHPWFLEGRRNFQNGNFDPNDPNNKANWYNFAWNGNTVTWEGNFNSGMPDLNLDNPVLRTEIEDITDFWLGHGVKGFRLDAVTYFYKKGGTENANQNINFLKWFDTHVKSIRPDAYIVAEAWIGSFENQMKYYGGVDSLFNFNGAGTSGYIINQITSRNGATLAFYLDRNYSALSEHYPDAQMAMFLTNHDMDRSSQMMIFDYEERQKLAASIYLLTPGVPFMYYGEEIALKGRRMVAETDANRRLPMIWQKTEDSMRTNPLRYMDYPIENQVKDGVREGLETPFSLLNHYRKVINIRNQYAWLPYGRLSNVPLNNNTLASLKLTSKTGEDVLHVIHNVVAESQEVDLARFISDYEVKIVHDIFTTGTRSTLKNGMLTLAPYSSVILERK